MTAIGIHRNAKISTAHAQSPTRVARVSISAPSSDAATFLAPGTWRALLEGARRSQALEGAEALHQGEIDGHDRERNRRERGRERQVVRQPEVLEDDRADQRRARPADERRR